MTAHITRIDTYITTSLQCATFYRGTRPPRTYVRPTILSLMRLCNVASKETRHGRGRLHPQVTGWSFDRLDNTQSKEQ